MAALGNGDQDDESAVATSDLLAPHFLARLERLALQARRRYRGRAVGSKETRQRGTGLEFDTHRAYVPGDDLKNLDWSLLARLDRPYLKTFQEQHDLNVHLCVDTSGSMAIGRPPKLLAAVRIAAALAHVALSSLDRVSVALYDDSGLALKEPGRGKGAFLERLRFLAAAKAIGKSGAATFKSYAARMPTGLVVILSDLLDPDIESALKPLVYRRHTIVLVQVLSAEDLEPALEGDLDLVDSETAAVLATTVGKRERRQYLERLHQHLRRLEAFSSQHQIELVRVPSELPLEEVFSRHLLRASFLNGGA